MAVADLVNGLKSGFEAEVAKLDVVKADYAAKIATADQIVTESEAEKLAAYNKGWDERGLNDGTQGDKTHTDEEVNEIMKPLQDQIAQLTQAQETMRLDLQMAQDRVAGIPMELERAATDAVAAFKAELKQKYEEQQVAEAQGETGFGSLLA